MHSVVPNVCLGWIAIGYANANDRGGYGCVLGVQIGTLRVETWTRSERLPQRESRFRDSQWVFEPDLLTHPHADVMS
jgi:hypothetical protein